MSRGSLEGCFISGRQASGMTAKTPTQGRRIDAGGAVGNELLTSAVGGRAALAISLLPAIHAWRP
jgi:hypothetical protein